MKKLILFASALSLLSCATNSTRQPASSHSVLDSSGYQYDPTDRSCDGLPRLKVETMPGTCLGLVIGKDELKANGKPLIMPRTILQFDKSDDFLLVDMGGWKDNNGTLYWMRKTNGGYQLVPVKTGLNLPHGLNMGPDGFIYIGQSQEIDKFHFENGKVVDWSMAVEMRRPKGDMHPLTQFAFDPRNGDMYVNNGAPTDHCQSVDNGNYASCPDSDSDPTSLGAVYHYSAAELAKGQKSIGDVTAKGLRNSMALVVSSAGLVVQGENGRDFPELEEPYEEINVIDHKGWNHGWPQCYDFHAVSPEWLYKNNDPRNLKKQYNPLDCAGTTGPDNSYAKPRALIPPHAAPLQMAYYNGQMFADLFGGKLLVGWHGYQPTGHRIVAYEVNRFGVPEVRKPDAGATFYMDQKGGCPVKHAFSPRGGLDQYAPYTEIVSGWDQQKGVRPRGSPTGFIVARDGSLVIVEDKNVDIVRLARTSAPPPPSQCTNTNQDVIDPRMELLAWRQAMLENPAALAGYEQVQTQVVQQYCAQCHGGFISTDVAQDKFQVLDFFVKNDWFVPGHANQSKIIYALTKSGQVPAMPPNGEKQISDISGVDQLVSNWINKLPMDVDKHVAKIKVGLARQVRDAANDQTSKLCGNIPAGDTVYVDPLNRATVNGVVWTKIFMLPGDSRLLANRCSAREDGVYWMRLK